MTTNNENPKPADNMELLKKQAAACGPECGCHATGSPGKARRIVGVLVLVAAGALVARAVVKNHDAPAAPASAGFAALPAPAPKPAAPAATPVDTDTVKELGALAELNTVAKEMNGVFVFLPGKGEATTTAPTALIRGAARTIEPKIQGKIGVFALKTGTPDYIQLAAQMTVPGVLALVKGRGMAPLTGEITEAKLVQAFVAASSAGGCGASGCGPGSAGCK